MKPSIDELFSKKLQNHGIGNCPSCNKSVDRGDVAWNNASTEAGTGYCVIEIQCQACDSEVFHTTSWWPSIDSFEDLAENFEDIID